MGSNWVAPADSLLKIQNSPRKSIALTLVLLATLSFHKVLLPTLIYNLLYVRGHLTGRFCYPIRSENFERPDLTLWHSEMEKKLAKENKRDRNKGARNLLGLLVSDVMAL